MKFTKRSVEAIKATDKKQFFFDDEVTGLALRVGPPGKNYPEGKKSFYYTYRVGRGRGAQKKWALIGSFPDWTVEQARQRAKELAADVQKGADPAAESKEEIKALTVSEALDAFTTEYVEKLKPKSIEFYNTVIDKHLRPAFGKLRIKALSFTDMAKMHTGMKATPYMANRCVAILSVFLNWCEGHGHRDPNTNPTKKIKLYTEHKRQEFMGAEELTALGDALAEMEAKWYERKAARTVKPQGQELIDTITPQSAAAIRLLMFTGARKLEILSMKWSYIDFDLGIAKLPDSKTGFKVLQLPAPAQAILEGLPQISEYCFPADSKTGHQSSLKEAWAHVLAYSGLSGWRIHDLRHAFASMMVNSGASLPIIGKILGHTQASTTQRYAHIAENPARKAAEDAAAKIANAVTKTSDKVIPFRKASGERV